MQIDAWKFTFPAVGIIINNRLDVRIQFLLKEIYLSFSYRGSSLYTFYLDQLGQPYVEKQHLAKAEDLFCLILEKLEMKKDRLSKEGQELLSGVYYCYGFILKRSQRLSMARRMFQLSLEGSNSENTSGHIVKYEESNSRRRTHTRTYLLGLSAMEKLEGRGTFLWAILIVFHSGMGFLLYLDEDSMKSTLLNGLLLFPRPMLFFSLLALHLLQRWKTLVLWIVGHVCFQVYYSSTPSTLDWVAYICGTFGEMLCLVVLMPLLLYEGLY
ncbi:hypothetical protein BO94DRAFT_585257 [Aspergillus sclerotioniger CBS 115572]|uniref:Uncharacterized protein n=1 Tax=Aspergillus sclerotioniger CBS 115572 TaxID=1450535 RepID=A0A317WVL2_9EURO|nr:hypothetical protein BO94DRAFT_585257 [Aspergillus sclerotioniger CBS 115572]PWY88888.1 hypothetical protein BO94DRAFT_585257 [Aspergillus sclerotioniger CBS 115572]